MAFYAFLKTSTMTKQHQSLLSYATSQSSKVSRCCWLQGHWGPLLSWTGHMQKAGTMWDLNLAVSMVGVQLIQELMRALDLQDQQIWVQPIKSGWRKIIENFAFEINIQTARLKHKPSNPNSALRLKVPKSALYLFQMDACYDAVHHIEITHMDFIRAGQMTFSPVQQLWDAHRPTPTHLLGLRSQRLCSNAYPHNLNFTLLLPYTLHLLPWSLHTTEKDLRVSYSYGGDTLFCSASTSLHKRSPLT